MIILGLDCALKTGWAITNNGKIIASGTQDFSKQRGESNGTVFLRYRNWLRKMLEDNQVFLVAYERAHHRGGAATEIAVNLTGRIQELCVDLGIEYAAVHTATLKKFACGSGKADKQAMIAAAEKIKGASCEDDNEADAILIARWANENYGSM